MITLLHGSEELIRSEHLAAIRASLGAAELADLSTTTLDGRKLTLAELRHHCDTLPFLSERRLVVVEGLIAQFARRRQAARAARQQSDKARRAPTTVEQELQALMGYLEQVPDTTELVLLETEQVKQQDTLFKRLRELAGRGEARILACEAPAQSDLPDWVERRAKAKGAAIERSAAYELATVVGRNLRLLDNELEKLIAYRSGDGPIRRQDVRLLVPYAKEANIFDMVDAIGRRDTATALHLLRELERDGAAPLYLLAMIVRQFRILIQVADQMKRGLDQRAIAAAIGLHPYPTGKAMQQCRHWRMAELEAAYDRLLETDLAIKTGKLPDELALELLVVELSQR